MLRVKIKLGCWVRSDAFFTPMREMQASVFSHKATSSVHLPRRPGLWQNIRALSGDLAYTRKVIGLDDEIPLEDFGGAEAASAAGRRRGGR